jgi:hypothetical protein
LKRGGGYTGFDELQAGSVPDPDWLHSEAEAISEFWEVRRLERLEGVGHARAAFKRANRAA